MNKAYNPKDHEEKIYQQWEKSGFFSPDVCVKKGVCKKDAPVFSIVLPPPNVTGTLHIGHAIMLVIEDIMVRYQRMSGARALWLPGTDHAAIATQSKVEKIIYEKQGKTRHDLGREAFLEKVEAFARESHDTIINQIKKMGSSVDWSREAYTLDKKRSLAVRVAFKRLYDEGLIYQGERIVNWDPKMQSTVSDDEIERREEKTNFYYLKYGPFVIGTARPETKFGDKYVVMHPDDNRYKQYRQGEVIELEWINGPIKATVIKDEAVDMSFGTGVMTITPWHDAVDFDIAERHNLDKEQIIDFDGRLLAIAGEFAGQDAHQARPKIIDKLRKKGLLVKIEDNYRHSLAVNSRGGGVIEPQIMKQWFVAVNKEFKLAAGSRIKGLRSGQSVTLKQLMRKAVENGQIEIVPQRFRKIYFHWIDNLRDWCISRQIWYGHRIPVWYHKKLKVKSEKLKIKQECTEPIVSVKLIENCPCCGGKLKQDPDTLDTWFSSALWTFSTLGWPEKTKDLLMYHPTSVLETGYDILFFWVAKMILMSTYLLGDIPFRVVYLHGLVRDEKGRKMSKSLGNTIDPADMIDKYGADALRLSLVMGQTPGNDLSVGEDKIQGSRNFVNKLWNIARFLETQSSSEIKQAVLPQEKWDMIDNWLLTSLHKRLKVLHEGFENYRFGDVAAEWYDFIWHDVADWYLEVAKLERDRAVKRRRLMLLDYVLESSLKALHAFIPFITEVIYQRRYRQKGAPSLLMVARVPAADEVPNAFAAYRHFEHLRQIISSARSLRIAWHVPAGQKIELYLETPGSRQEILKAHQALIAQLTKARKVLIGAELSVPKHSAVLAARDVKIAIPLGKLIDIGKERARLQEELKKARSYCQQLKIQLAKPSFKKQAPPKVVQDSQRRLEEMKIKVKTLEKSLKTLR